MTVVPLRFIIAILLMGAAASSYVSSAVSVEIGVVVPPIQRLEISNALQNTSPPGGSDFQEGHIELPQAVLLNVYSNIAWQLEARVPRERGDPGSILSSGRITCSTEEGHWNVLGDDWLVIATGMQPVAAGEVRVRIRLPLDWERTVPGMYAPDIEYRLSALRD